MKVQAERMRYSEIPQETDKSVIKVSSGSVSRDFLSHAEEKYFEILKGKLSLCLTN
jgi:hypothetical protein